jgi:hypothetical protein
VNRYIVAALAAVSVATAGCAGREGNTDDTGAGPTPVRAEFNAANFVGPTTAPGNKWHPLKPGTQWVREGTTEVGGRAVPHQVISTVTDVIREIDGVKSVALLDEDIDSGQTVQMSIDYMALDNQDNVWLMGSYTEEYEGGQFVASTDAGLGAQSRSEPGILVPADATLSTPRWFSGRFGAGDPQVTEVVATGTDKCVKFACYKDVLIVREGKGEEIDNEFKYYAPGVGQIYNEPKLYSKHHDIEDLVNLTQLTSQGLDEASEKVLELEEHARIVEPEIFGPAPAATRANTK